MKTKYRVVWIDDNGKTHLLYTNSYRSAQLAENRKLRKNFLTWMEELHNKEYKWLFDIPKSERLSVVNKEVGISGDIMIDKIIDKDFKKRIKLWSASKLKMKFKHYYNAMILSPRPRERDILRNRWLLDAMKAIKSEFKKRGIKIVHRGAKKEITFSPSVKDHVGNAVDDVGANVGVAIGAFIIAGAVGFGLYKLVLEPVLAGKLPEDEDNGEPNGVTPVTPASFKPSLGRRYQIANVNEFANIRKGPRLGAGLLSDLPTIGKLGKVYVCLNRQQDSAGYWWCQVISPRILLWLGGWIRTDKLKSV